MELSTAQAAERAAQEQLTYLSSTPFDTAAGLVIEAPEDGLLLQTFAIMGRSINTFELREADVVMRPKLAGVSGADFSARKRSIQAGRDVATAMLTDLKARITAKTR